jgi:hypothetical protein
VDVIGLELEDARRRLQAAGVTDVSISETRPPMPHVQLNGPLRVVRQRLTSTGGVELVVTPERYDPASLRPKPRER